MNEADGVLGFIAQTKVASSVKGLGAWELKDLNPFAGFRVEYVNASIAEAEKIGVH